MNCPRCGTENPAGNKFCMTCGADMMATTGAGSAAGQSEASAAPPPPPPPGEPAPAPGGYSSGRTPPPPPPSSMPGIAPGGYSSAYSPPSGVSMGAPGYAPFGAAGSMALQGTLADPGSRFLAYLIDVGVIIAAAIVVSILAAILGAIHLGFLGGLLLFLLWVAVLCYTPYFWATQNGQTLGKKAMHIRVVRVDGQPLTIGTAIVRYIGYWISSFVFYLGYLWILWDPQKQGWHDKIANTFVVRAP